MRCEKPVILTRKSHALYCSASQIIVRKYRPNSLNYQTEQDEVQVGTNVKCAAVQGFGAIIRPGKARLLAFPGKNGKMNFATKVAVPAQEFLGIAQSQIQLVQQTIEQSVKDVANSNV